LEFLVAGSVGSAPPIGKRAPWRRGRERDTLHVIASEAKQSIAPQAKLDCFVAALLAMTVSAAPRPEHGG
jgi:hypothetical protein